ncbi:ubiquitin thioesterase OTUB1-like [Antedon mediterranea]|uniref:ubiquitin thioesterase OTUB1-like n=1 Tax=Antedon mediterranea TaxID=105859 RepID=UPI003AF4691D
MADNENLDAESIDNKKKIKLSEPDIISDVGRAKDEDIIAQEDRIQNEIKENTGLIGAKEDLSSLLEQYADDEVYQQKIRELRGRYHHVRKSRPDGNCFFRSFGYAYMEYLLSDKEELHRFKEIALKSKDELVSLGFPTFTIEEFHETFMEVIDQVETHPSIEDIQMTFNDQSTSDYIVVYLRLLTSGQLQKQADFYASFIEGNRTVREFCHQEVEPMAKESDHIHIIALSSKLQVGVRVVYLDRGSTEKANQHDFPDDWEPKMTLLYRPGHYDILYA